MLLKRGIEIGSTTRFNWLHCLVWEIIQQFKCKVNYQCNDALKNCGYKLLYSKSFQNIHYPYKLCSFFV